MIRSLYSLLLTLLLPLAFVRLWFKGRTNPDYMQRWGERLGYMPDLPKRPRLWVHAVSVGETRAAQPLLDAAAAAAVKKDLGDRWVIDLRKSPVDAAPLQAFMGAYGAYTRPAPPPPPPPPAPAALTADAGAGLLAGPLARVPNDNVMTMHF